MDRQMQTYLRSQSNDLSALKKQTDLQNKIQAHALKIAVDTNRELKSINETLNAMGFVMEEVAGSLQRQEKMHAEHYDAVKKEKALKEILYNFKKFHTAASQTGDSIVGASGARILSQVVTSAGFSTKDLSDIADKEYFDERMGEAKSLVAKLSPTARNELDDFEYAYGAYQYLKDYDLKSEYPFVSTTPVPGKLPASLDGFPLEKLPLVFEMAALDKPVRKWTAIALLTSIGLGGVGLLMQGSAGMTILGTGFAVGGLTYLTKVAPIRDKVIQMKKELPAKLRTLEPIVFENHLTPWKGYTDQVAAEVEAYEKEQAELSAGLEAKKKSFAGIINAFIQAHPGIAEFYPRVE